MTSRSITFTSSASQALLDLNFVPLDVTLRKRLIDLLNTVACNNEQAYTTNYLVGVGTPVSIPEREYDFSFLDECRKPLLLVHGERDEFGTVPDLRALAARLPAGARVEVKIIPGAGHFFDEQLEDLRRAVAGWATAMLRTREP